MNFYKNKKVLITGHTGFKGSWLAIWLNHLGVDVVGISLDPKTERDLFVLSDLKNKIKDYREDIRNLDKLKEIFQKEQPEIVFHLAAQALVLDSYENPVSTYETNIMGTVNILEAIRQTNSVRAAVMVTSDKCYENKEWEWGYRENDPMGGFDPYSSSKGAAELVINAYRNSFFNTPDSCGIASARAGNVIGGGDWATNRIIPDSIRAFEKDEKVFLRNPEATRPWQHVLEPLGGYLLLAERVYEEPQKYSQAWNFGPGPDNQKSVKYLTESLIRDLGKGEFDFDKKNNPHEANLLALDISKALNKLKWKPILNFEQTIEFTANWYLNYRNADVSKLCIKQIEEYINKGLV
jgi:CDP-glucose 4,6-dehydratase